VKLFDEPLSNFAFNFILRRYVEGGVMTAYEVTLVSKPSTLPIDFTVTAKDTDRLEFRLTGRAVKFDPRLTPG